VNLRAALILLRAFGDSGRHLVLKVPSVVRNDYVSVQGSLCNDVLVQSITVQTNVLKLGRLLAREAYGEMPNIIV
jgi:hypothetical protein